MEKGRKIIVWLPFIVAIVLAAGVYMGKQMVGVSPTYLFSEPKFSNNDKLNQILQFVESDYVDSVEKAYLVEETISELLTKLDPHSSYIPSSKYNEVNDPLDGNFEGIGVEFRIKEDTVVVVNPLGGGPSEKLGILAGDRIIEVEEESIAGNGITNRKVLKLLKGPKGTEVNIKVKRKDKLIDFAITRDKIPYYSVEASYMVNETIGYVKIVRFAKDTYKEFDQAITKLQADGMQKLILDLRNNGGGYMQGAIKIADEFVSNDKLIVYTEGRSRKRQDFYASSKGKLENVDFALLINENSASASEILAGALQDNDLGTLIGRRTFGKGLVQEGVQWPDGSAVRLTVARYYTPTGRSIQKPYSEDVEAYHSESWERYTSGELYSVDSIQFPDSLKFETPLGKTVYGGGGIMPDVYVPIDTSGISDYFGKLNYQGMFYRFGFYYVDKYRENLKEKYTIESYLANFNVNQKVLEEFYSFAEEKGVEGNSDDAKQNMTLIKSRIKATIGRNLLGDEIFYRLVNQQNDIFIKAVESL